MDGKSIEGELCSHSLAPCLALLLYASASVVGQAELHRSCRGDTILKITTGAPRLKIV